MNFKIGSIKINNKNISEFAIVWNYPHKLKLHINEVIPEIKERRLATMLEV